MKAIFALTALAVACYLILFADAKIAVLYPLNGSVVSAPFPVVVQGEKECIDSLELIGAKRSVDVKKVRQSPTELALHVGLNSAPVTDLTLESLCQKFQLQLQPAASETDVAAKLLESFIKKNPADSLAYDWTTAILLMGVVQYLEVMKGDSALYKNYVEDFFRYHLKRGLPDITQPDLAAISLAAVDLKNRIGTELNLKPLIEETQNYFLTEPINSLGALNHVGTRHRFHRFLPRTENFTSAAVWADSLVMYALAALKLSQDSGDQSLKKFALAQPQIFADKLMTSEGLYKHAFYIDSRELTPKKSFWSRGNGWVALAFIDFLEVLPEGDVRRKDYAQLFTNHIDAMVKELGELKVFKTLLRDENKNNYYETSSSALVAYAMLKGHRLGFLSADYRNLALEMYQNLLGFVVRSEDGTYSLKNISGPTTSSTYDWYYRQWVRPQSDLTYGLGAFLLLQKELIKGKSL